VVYFAPNSEQGFLDAVSAAVHDRRHRPSILSISWGQSESAWARQTLRAIDEVFAEAAAMGMTVFCASGDLGSANGVPGGAQHVNFPASSPYVLGCGGTSLAASGGHIVNETVWNDALGASGGGVSAVFPVPEWQRRAGVPASANPGGHRGRGVPDIAATAEGYRAFIEGSWGVGHGTSAVAPLFAGLMARINQKLRRPAGYLNPLLYRQYGELLQLGALREITAGRNGAYRARKGWDACTGLGSPRGAALAAVLGKRL
jgi:kumamolisin